MKKILWMSLALAAVWLTGCESEERGGPTVPAAVQSVFDAMYPEAENVAWSDKGGYYVAGFAEDGTRTEAWFDGEGDWYMTETDVAFDALPEAVRTAFAASEYAAWRVEDVEVLTREDMEPLYVVEVEQGETEAELVYTADGVPVRTTVDTDEDDDRGELLPERFPAAMQDYLDANYPQARLIDVDREREGYEVDILDGSTPRELYFDAQGAWLRTETEVREGDLPEPVIAAWQASEYAGWELDDATLVEEPGGDWYKLELEDERTDREAMLRVRPDGTVF